MSFLKRSRIYTVTTIAATTAIASVAPVAISADESAGFSDINQTKLPDKEVRSAIHDLAEKGAIKGFPDGTFKPGAPVERGHIAQIMTLALGLPIPEDVDQVNAQYRDADGFGEKAPYIAAVTNAGIFRGGDEGEFGIWHSITREQLASVIERYMTSLGIEPDHETSINLEHVSPIHHEGVQYVADLGLTKEIDNYRASEDVTRAQLATFIYRALKWTSEAELGLKVEDISYAQDELTFTFNKNVADDTFVGQDLEIKDGTTEAAFTVDEATTENNVLTVQLDDQKLQDVSAGQKVTSLTVEDQTGHEVVVPDDGYNIQLKKEHDDAVDDNEKASNQMNQLNIEEIEVEAKYAEKNKYEAEIEHKSDGTYTSELADDMENDYLKGEEAFDALYPMVRQLNIKENSEKEDVLDQVISAFDLDDPYEEIEVEVDFHDSDTEMEYEDS